MPKTPPNPEYAKFLRCMNSLGRFGSKPGLERIQKLLGLLGHPQKNYRCILVAGTNGKGSTTAFLSSALSASGKKTGAYFSPHLFSFCERIQVNGKNISEKELLAAAKPVLRLLPSLSEDAPTFFEVATAMALLHFSKAHVDYAVLEIGLGGRLDATNAVEPILSILTSIGLEHTDVLGKTTEKIAREKAGIMREGVPVISGVQEKKAKHAIRARAKKLNAKFIDVKKGVSFPLRASGTFQNHNAAIAMKAAQLLGVRTAVAGHAISTTLIPGRWQKISSKPFMIIDCAHNPPAVKAILSDVKRDFAPSPRPARTSRLSSPPSPRILLFAAMNDKNYPEMLRLLLPYFDGVVLCRPPFARAEKLNKLRKAVQTNRASSPLHLHAIQNPNAALAFSRRMATPRGRVLVCGSIYLLASLFGEKGFQLTS